MRAARTDCNQRDIVDALRRAGASVTLLHTVGQGCPDLLAGFRDRNYLLEVKSEHGKLNQREQEWHWAWAGQVCVVTSPTEALQAIGACIPREIMLE